jgi:hypothetical protein
MVDSACKRVRTDPYSFSKVAVTVVPGSLPGLRTGAKAAPNLSAIIGPNRNPRASSPTTTSIFPEGDFEIVSEVKWWTKFVINVSKARGFRRMGKMSKKTIP